VKVNVEHNAKLKWSVKPGFVLLVTVAVLLGAALAAGPASARQIRLFSRSFGAATSVPSDPYPLSSGYHGPSSVAVDNTSGDVYVTDQGNRRIEKFTSTGEFILMFGKQVNKTAVEASGSEAEQNICTASGDTCQAGVQASSPGAFDPANTGISNEETDVERGYLFVAVDNSSGPSKGDVYVADSGDHLITKFDSTDKVVGGWGNNGPGGLPNGQLNGSAATAPIKGFYTFFEGLATDSAGNLWVADWTPVERNGEVAEFRQDSSFVTDWETGIGVNGFIIGDERRGMALDSLDNVYIETEKYAAAGNWVGMVGSREGKEDLQGVTVDPITDELYFVAGGGGEIVRYDASCKPFEHLRYCTPVESFGAGRFSAEGSERVWSLAIDPSGSAKTVYASELRGEVAAFSIETVPDVETRKASGFTATSAVLNGTVNPSGVALSECFFEWGESSSPYEHSVACEPNAAGVGSGVSQVAVHAAVSGLAAGKTYHFRLVAGNANDINAVIDEPSQGADVTFGPPLLESSGVAAVSSTAATLQAQVDPNGVDTHMHFEYGTEAGVYPNSTPAVDVGSGETASVSRPIQGLTSLITYHYRVVLENIFGTVVGEDHSFTTQGAAFAGLPDGRAWELVSPPDKNGVPLEAISREGGVIQAASDGSALTYIAKGAIDAEPAGNRSFAETQLLAHRGGGGWSTVDIATPHRAPAGFSAGYQSEYELFSNDLSVGLVEPAGATPLSLEASEKTPYLRQAGGGYVPLVYPGNVPAETKFGPTESGIPELFNSGGVQFAVATPDFSHVVLRSSAVLSAPSFTTHGADSLYEWAAGALSLVSEIPVAPATVCGGSGAPCAPAAAKGFSSQAGSVVEDEVQVRHAVSDDGNRVFFESSESLGAGAGLYLRDSARGETLRLDVPEVGAGGGKDLPVFQDASVDGGRVFFLDESKLTVNAKASENKPDLYMCEVGESADHLACALKDLTVDQNVGESADVRGDVIGSAGDGSSVYFVANGALAGVEGAVHGNCVTEGHGPLEVSAAASCNLYRYDAVTGGTSLVAVLSSRDRNDWSSNLGRLTAEVSGSGRWLSFMSQRSLTGYDNRDAVSGQPDEEVFLYDASAEGGKGKLVCASCNPTGARPAGVLDQSDFPGMLVDRLGNWHGLWLAASVPGWTRWNLGAALYQSRYLSDSGRLFFNAADALVPGDSNGSEDVYQYEPPGVGGCTGASPTFGRSSGGCVDLISSGTSGEESAFLDASESGNDVFFLSSAGLASQDVDSAIDVYDAHVCSAESPCPPPPPPPPPACEGDACQSPVSAPDDPTPGSLTFHGPGNLTFAAPAVVRSKAKPLSRAQKLTRALSACRKKPKKKRSACQRQARHAYGPVGKAKSVGRAMRSNRGGV
jgi:hypothetical protein